MVISKSKYELTGSQAQQECSLQDSRRETGIISDLTDIEGF